MTADTRCAATTPEGVRYELSAAGLIARGLAFGIDGLIQAVVLFILSTLLDLLSTQWLILLVYFGLTWFYNVFFDVFSGGRSPGKRIMRLRVVMSNGAPVSLEASFVRNLLRFADSFMSLTAIGVGVLLASSGFRRLGDWAADTLVVYDSPGLPKNRRVRRNPPASSVAPCFPTGLGYEEKQSILKFCRRYPLLGSAVADEICVGYMEQICPKEERRINPSEYLLALGNQIQGV